MYKNAKPILSADKDSITWLKGDDPELLYKTNARYIVCLPHLAKLDISGKMLIPAESPKQKFIELTKHLVPEAAKIVVGNNIKISPGVVLGSEGFGYSVTKKGIEKFPHFGGVVIGDNVDIGANTCIERGALGDTIIGSGTKIDNLVHIAHNAEIGKNCLIVALSGIGGSCIIGDGVYIGFGATIKNGVRIGRGATVGMGAVVLKNIPDNEIWVGNPARKLY